ncbi:MAG: iron ABC transporter permease [Limnobacter sp.]|nr:iron ABC transporter permease [Limnobacter sp.]
MFAPRARSQILVSVLAVLLLTPFVYLLGLSVSRVLADSSNLVHLAYTVLPDLLWQTSVLCAGVAVLTSTMGVLPAWWVSAHEFNGRRWLEWALLLPMAMPSYVIAYAYTDALQYSGWISSALRAWFGSQFRLPEIRSLGGAILVLSFVLYPYVYIMARAAFMGRSPSLTDAARSMGHGPISAFLRVGLPVARPAWVAGLALVLMETLAEYGALNYFGVQTFATGIYKTWLNLGDRDSAALLALMLLVLVLGLLVAESSARGDAKYYTQHSRGQKLQRTPLKGFTKLAVVFFSLMPFVLGFVLPVVFLLVLVAGPIPCWCTGKTACNGHCALLRWLCGRSRGLGGGRVLSYVKRQNPVGG